MSKNIKIITFYLPQYHSIPENDLWWGKDFTDWINVKKSKPRYLGHYQPHIPSELGYYDLSDENIRIKQADLASEYGISAFCYYHYWFNGKMLLEKPFNEVLKSGKPDFPFCLCWANENWTRRWDGLDSEILMKQDYVKYDAEEHIKWLSDAFKDNRHIKINGKPLFLIYNLSSIPDSKSIIDKWRVLIKKYGFDDIYLCSVQSIHNKLSESETIQSGIDAIVEFIPSSEGKVPKKVSGLPRYFTFRLINKLIEIFKLSKFIKKLPVTIIHDYKKFSVMRMNKSYTEKTFPCVIPSWDNSARKRVSASYQNENPELFKKWLIRSFQKVVSYENEEQIIFINAWNEWAEGCHLEPDQKNGRMFLNAVKEALNEFYHDS